MIAFYLICALAILWGIRLMSSPETAVRGNIVGSAAVLAAVVAVLVDESILGALHLITALLIGGGTGLYLALRIKIIAMPQFVAVLNGLGGGASALVALVVLGQEGLTFGWEAAAAALALLVGGLTFSGSAVAAGKLAGLLPQRSLGLPQHSLWVAANGAAAVFLLIWVSVNTAGLALVLLSATALLFGILFTVPIGGADMPVTISLLNSFSGMAGAIAGFALGNVLVVAAGGIVGAAGLILTQIMCRGMNRSLPQILLGKTTQSGPVHVEESSGRSSVPAAEAAALVAAAEKIIIVPGYGMAVAQAQEQVAELLSELSDGGRDVRIAIHPVAGRMPGHMNVLLAEVDVPYSRLFALEEINDFFAETDVVVVVGANDVVNPAALEAKGTAIYGMPILNVHESKACIICNVDTKPGYAGVDNALYDRPNTHLLLGDAKQSLNNLLRLLRSGHQGNGLPTKVLQRAKDLLRTAKRVIIVPGYGMAVAQAQGEVKRLLINLEQRGVDVKVAIHPVAGRMPGHMNVLLAEVDVPYSKLFPLEEINEQFFETDVAVVVGANDVVNPAALEAKGTAIYGMPILAVHQARSVIICNFDTNPGYSGTANPLYEDDTAELLLGDARTVLKQVNDYLELEENAADSCS